MNPEENDRLRHAVKRANAATERIKQLEAELAKARKDGERQKAVVDMWFAYVSLDGTETDDVELMLAFGKAADATKAARGAK